MNKKYFAVLGFLLTLGNSSIFAMDVEPRFYLGVEAQSLRNTVVKNVTADDVTIERFDKKPLFSKNSFAGGLFLGSFLNERFGLELGYSQFKKNKSNESLSDGVTFFGSHLAHTSNSNFHANPC